jgi:hypothetical protein
VRSSGAGDEQRQDETSVAHAGRKLRAETGTGSGREYGSRAGVEPEKPRGGTAPGTGGSRPWGEPSGRSRVARMPGLPESPGRLLFSRNRGHAIFPAPVQPVSSVLLRGR